jgi:hypothetical protein
VLRRIKETTLSGTRKKERGWRVAQAYLPWARPKKGIEKARSHHEEISSTDIGLYCVRCLCHHKVSQMNEKKRCSIPSGLGDSFKSFKEKKKKKKKL